MATWAEFEAADPDLARLGAERFERFGLALVGTVSSDGYPRISPVEPIFVLGQLYLGMMWQSRKALDLLRDPRVLVHSVVSNRDGSDGEFKLRGRAVPAEDPDAREAYAEALYARIGWRPEGPYHLFATDIKSAAFIAFDEGQMSVRRWKAG